MNDFTNFFKESNFSFETCGCTCSINTKTTAVRVIPAIGKKEGESLSFGGLLGEGPVMRVNTGSPAKFINRGGQIPAPIQSLKN